MRHASETKEAVLALVKSGKTYAEIQSEFPIPKSTISTWVKNEGIVHDRTKQLEHLKKARAKAVEIIHKNKTERRALDAERARQELFALPLENISVQKSLLAMLYWAEGTKGESSALVFVNTDPLLVQLYIWLLRNCYEIEEHRLRVRVHVGYWHDHSEVIKFWSELLKVPGSQFGKIYVKKRSTSTQKKFRKNYRGICSVIYGNESIRQELLMLGRLIAENTKLPSFNG